MTMSGSAFRLCLTQEPRGIRESECLPLLYTSRNASPTFMKQIQMFCMTIACLVGATVRKVWHAAKNNESEIVRFVYARS